MRTSSLLVSVAVVATIACQNADHSHKSLSTLASSTTGRTTMVADSRYKMFETEDEAFTWAKAYEARNAAQSANPARSILPHTDPNYAKAQQVVDAIWSGYQRLYPNIIGSLNAPYVIIISDPDANAYATYDPTLGKMPLVFFIQTGALVTTSGASLSEAQLYGLVGHELAHLVMAHGYPGVFETRAIHFRILAGQEQLGFLQEDQPDIKRAVAEWSDQAKNVGEFPYAELNGFPAFTGNLTEIWPALARTRASLPDAPPVCAHMIADSASLRSFSLATLNQLDFTWPLDAAGKDKLNSLTTPYAADATQCFAGGLSFSQSLRMLISDESQFDEAMKDPSIASEKDNPNTFTAINNVTKAAYAKMNALLSSNDYATMRVRTFEEEADDNAMLVTHLIGQDSRGLGSFFLKIMMPDADRDPCTKILAEGKIPGYGLLAEPHHAACYRIYHVNLYHNLIFGNK